VSNLNPNDPYQLSMAYLIMAPVWADKDMQIGIGKEVVSDVNNVHQTFLCCY